MEKKKVSRERVTNPVTNPPKGSEVFSIAGVDYKMVGVNDDGTPVLKSLQAIEQEKALLKAKASLERIVGDLRINGVDIRVTKASGQVSIEVFDKEVYELFKAY